MGRDRLSPAVGSSWTSSPTPQYHNHNYFGQPESVYNPSGPTTALMTPSPSISESSETSSSELNTDKPPVVTSNQIYSFEPQKQMNYYQSGFSLSSNLQDLDPATAQAKSRRCKSPTPNPEIIRSTPKAVKKKHLCLYSGCGKVYSKISHLKAHLRWHNGIRPYHCPYENCTKSFIRSDELSRHIWTHTGEKRYVCDQCEKAFARSDHFSKHSKVHSKEGSGIMVAKRGRKSLQTRAKEENSLPGIAQDSNKVDETKPPFLLYKPYDNNLGFPLN